MKKILSIISLIIAFSVSVSAFADFEYGHKVKNSALDLPVDEASVMKNGAIIYEAEKMTLGSDVSVIEDDTASGGAAVTVTESGMISEASQLSSPSISFTYTADETNRYYFWAKIRTLNEKTNSSIHYSLDNSTYSTLWGIAQPGNVWQWRLLGCANIKAGQNVLSFKRRIRGLSIDKILITSNTQYSSEGNCDPENFSADSSLDTSQIYPIPEIKPISGHPRIILSRDYLPAFKENIKSEELAKMYDACLSLADEELDCDMQGTKNDSTLLKKIKARAIAYVAGSRDESHGRQTVEYMKKYMSTCYYSPTVGDITRNIGDCMFTGALVYDWCYDLLTASDKEFFIRQFKTLSAAKEIGYPPTKMINISGHSGEQEIFQDLLSAGIAVYDEDPEIYNLAAGRLFSKMADSRTYFNNTGAHPVTIEYSFWRHANEAVADLIYYRMGFGHIFGDNMYLPSIKNIYMRLGMGKWVKQGDSFEYAINTNFNYDTYDYQDMAIIGGLYKNPYIKHQAMRDTAIKNNSFDFWTLVCAEPGITAKSEEDLPLTYKSTYPLTSIVARTGWKPGIDSPAAVAYMEAREKIISDHMHMQLGGFSLYYKGNLAVESGTYKGSSGAYGSEHDINYNKRTIAGNCVTVYDPDEKFYYSASSYNNDGYFMKKGKPVANDGGQVFRVNVAEFDEFLNMQDFARTDGFYVGPNEQTPEFSYVKTNLSDAYSDKVKSYDRYMVFMNLDNEDYPAAMVVFDKVESSNKSFKKKWLLHSIEEPAVEGNTTVIARTENGFNGKLVNKTLLPDNNNFTIEKVGGEGKEFMVDGYNYESKPNTGTVNEAGSWRIELSPSKENTKDSFLNAMYVTDYDRNLPELPVYKAETSDMTGAVIRDRQIMFAKDGDRISAKSAVALQDNGFSDVKCMIADVREGLWKVTEHGTDNSIFIKVKDDEHTLYFCGTAGKTYIIEPVSSGEETIFAYPEMQHEVYGEFEIYDGVRFVYDKYGTKLIDGVPYIPLNAILGKYGIDVKYNGNNTVTASNTASTDILTFDSASVIKNGEETVKKHKVLNINNMTYICPLDFPEFVTASYNAAARVLKITIPDYSQFTSLDTAKAVVPVAATSSGDDGNSVDGTIDYNLTSRWSCEGDNAWAKYDLGDIYDLDYTQIYWKSGNVRKEYFDILISDDDVNYKTVFSGESSGTTDGFEQFGINASARYVKILCHGNSISKWNSIGEIFIMKK